jgi:3-dehydroquinate synthase
MKMGPSPIARPSGIERLTVELGERSYPILIGPGLLKERPLLEQCIASRDVLLVSNPIVAPLYAERLTQALSGRRVVTAILPDGEAHKTLATASRLLDVLVANRLGRDAAVVALGGGVVGDIAGFAAACYQRGIAYVQAPTTLLAQVDSSVGGKTGVNHPGGKNLIGAFYQPVAVVTDTSTLETLAPREMRAGLAEIIKYGLIRDATLYEWLQANIARLLAHDPQALAHAIRRSCEIKAEIVGGDEREQGERALLNLGHTFGHALESATAYARWLHGEAVGVGLLMAASMSQACGTLGADEVESLRGLVERTGLPTTAREVPAEQVLERMKIDKKVKAGRIRLVLLRGVGDAYVTGDYPDRALEATVRAYCS